jgi:DNA repair protein RecO (recombination protein O)
MSIRSTCGIVLKISDHGESDKLVTLYCSDLGRITGIAKGAKKSRQRFVNKLEEFTHLNIFYRPPKGDSGLYLISEADLLAAHLSLRTDFYKYIAATYLCELILRFTRENDPDPRLYILLKWAISALHNEKTTQKIVILAHLHLLDTVGYRPELSQCTCCRQVVGPGRTYMLLPGTGALYCSMCFPRNSSPSLGLSVQTLRLLANAQVFELNRLHRLHFTQRALFEAMTALHFFTVHLLQQDVHSWQILLSLFSGRTLLRKIPSVPWDSSPGHA